MYGGDELEQPPSAAALIESLRGLGYSAGSAIADLVDNSLAAGARNVWISLALSGSGDSRLIVLDDGHGMDAPTLLAAMRPGSMSPLATRDASDLGRFGLGLKTASFSLARQLTVASQTASSGRNVLRWDLDHVSRLDRWQLLEGAPPNLEAELKHLGPDRPGTLVMLSGLDRLVGDAPELIETIGQHLGLVFHRFIESGRLSLHTSLNPDPRLANKLRPVEPFMRDHTATKRVGHDRIDRGCSLTGYVLPHHDLCTEVEWQRGGLAEGWVQAQGCYVYRNERLLISGGWMRLRRGWRRSVDTQLARVQIDFDNTWDERWKIDVLKSRAAPPRELRDRLADLAQRVREESIAVHQHRRRRVSRGVRRTRDDRVVPGWHHEEGVGFRINRSHPIVKRLLEESGSSAGEALGILEMSLPVVTIWQRLNDELGATGTFGSETVSDVEIAQLLRQFVSYQTSNVGHTLAEAFETAAGMEPFCDHEDVVVATMRLMGLDGPL